MHIGVFADIEGSFGIWRMRQCRMGTREWQYGRECLTEDVNAVIAGAFYGGAEKVTVKDTHETGFNCLIPKLDKRVHYVGGHFIKPSLFGHITDYDLVLYVAIHAASGTPDAFFPHTHSGIFSEVRINGKVACEMDVYGGYLGEFGVPIGFVSGEDVAVKQALNALPWAKSVVVDKSREAYTSGEKSRQYLKQGRKQLHNEAMEAVKHAGLMKPLALPGPIHVEVKFRIPEMAKKFNTWDFPQNGNQIEQTVDNMIEVIDMLNKLAFMPKKIYPYRRPLFFLTRKFFKIKHTYFAPRPNREGASN